MAVAGLRTVLSGAKLLREVSLAVLGCQLNVGVARCFSKLLYP